jgi:formyltetrahydrofolate-dependent phosphoribosylglycinamide formyltransferase
MERKIRMAVLIGGGSRLPAIYEYTQRPDARAEIVLVTSHKKQSAGLQFATERGLNAVPHRWAEWKAAGKSRQEFDAAVGELLERNKVELVVLAGWGLLLTDPFLARWGSVTLNVHPALITDTLQSHTRTLSGGQIPVFRGNNAIEDAWNAEVSVTGCSVHYVTAEMDVGPVILRREVPVAPSDTLETLSARVHAAEDSILPIGIDRTCRTILENPLTVR